MTTLTKWLREKRFYMRSRPMIRTYQWNGKKYVMIVMCGWFGAKWARRFEIVDEVDECLKPIPFSGPILDEANQTRDTRL